MSYAAAVLADNPTAYWRLGDPPMSAVMADSSGNGFHGAYDYTFFPDLPVTGFPGLVDDTDTCFRETIQQQYAYAPVAAPAGPVTVEAVILPAPYIPDDSGSTIVLERNQMWTLRARWFFNAEYPRGVQLIWTYSTEGGTVRPTVDSYYFNRTDGQPIHVAVRHDPGTGYGTDGHTAFYVDGVLLNETIHAPSGYGGTVPNEPVRVGGKIDGSIGPFFIDEVAVYGGLLAPARLKAHADLVPRVVTGTASIAVTATADIEAESESFEVTGVAQITVTASAEIALPWEYDSLVERITAGFQRVAQEINALQAGGGGGGGTYLVPLTTTIGGEPTLVWTVDNKLVFVEESLT